MSLSTSEKMRIAVELYKRGDSLSKAASTAGVSVSGLWKYMIRNGLPRRSQGRTRRVTAYLREVILREHLVEGIGVSTIARKHNLSKATVRRIFQEEGKLTYSLSQLKRKQALVKDAALSPRIIDLYRKGFPVKEIAKLCKTSQRRVSRIVREFVRSISTAATTTYGGYSGDSGEDTGLGHRGQQPES